MGILGPVADQVKELGRLCPVWENRHSYQSIIAPFLLPENLQQKNVDVDAVLNQLQDTFVLTKLVNRSQEINVFVKISTILDQRHKAVSNCFSGT